MKGAAKNDDTVRVAGGKIDDHASLREKKSYLSSYNVASATALEGEKMTNWLWNWGEKRHNFKTKFFKTPGLRDPRCVHITPRGSKFWQKTGESVFHPLSSDVRYDYQICFQRLWMNVYARWVENIKMIYDLRSTLIATDKKKYRDQPHIFECIYDFVQQHENHAMNLNKLEWRKKNYAQKASSKRLQTGARCLVSILMSKRR